MPAGDDRDPDDDDRKAGDDDRASGPAEGARADDDDAPDSDDGDGEEPDEPVEGDDPTAPPIDRALVVRFLGTREALRIATAAVRAIVPRDVVEDLAAGAVTRGLTAPPPRSERALPAWLRTIARRRAIKWLEKRKRRAKYEGEMPGRGPVEDAYTGEAVEPDLEPAELAYDPEEDARLSEMLGAALDRFVGDDAHDLETRDMIREHASEKKTYAQIAKERRTTPAAIKQRIYRFKVKYAKRVERRNRMMLWLKIGGGVVLAVAAVIAYLLLRRPPVELIGPDPDIMRPVPSASVTGPDIARPTQPSASASTAPPEPAPPLDGPKPGQK